jgi:4-hydroxy-tetrahydrodipicolinate reductase
MIKLAVSGCLGRMGQSITRLALADSGFTLTALLEHKDHPKAHETIHGLKIHTDNIAIKESDVLIEFTTPEATLENLHVCMALDIKMVIGTTGFQPEHIDQIRKTAEHIPIVFASNMSVGVNVLFKLIELTTKKIGPSTVHITETHHVHKKDAPSGTAKSMREIAEAGLNQKVGNIESIREGEVIGDHDIIFETPEDVLTIKHHAKTRDMFAKGALTAAKFLQNKSSGLYTMQDVLGLSNIKI